MRIRKTLGSHFDHTGEVERAGTATCGLLSAEESLRLFD
jgi:hypothetical protein